jgi:hypothetical protein
VRGRLFRAVDVVLANHRDLPDCQGGGHNVRLTAGIGIPQFHRGKLCMPQAFFDQLSCRFPRALSRRAACSSGISTSMVCILYDSTGTKDLDGDVQVASVSASTDCRKDSERCGVPLNGKSTA